MSSRLERLFNLTAALLSTARPLTREELHQRVPGYPPEDAKASARRAFERDKEALREMGIPISVEEVDYDGSMVEGYRIIRDQYALRDPGLAPDELAALQLATAAVRLEGLRATDALWKLGGTTAEVAGENAVAAIPTIPGLVPLFVAVSERRSVTFGYRDQQRHVEPHRLSFARGHWYLDGYDQDRQAPRQFRLDRLEGEVSCGPARSFERPPTLPAAHAPPWQMGDEAPLWARVRIDADLAGWGVDHLGSDAVAATHDDGSVEVELLVTNREAFRSFVFGFLDHAEVLAPAELRNDLVAWLEAVAG